MPEGADIEERQAGQRDQRHRQRHLVAQRHPENVERQEDRVKHDPQDRVERCIEPGYRAEIGRDERTDHGRRKHVLDVLEQPSDEAAPRPHGAARERVGGAGMWQRRAHLGDREGQAQIHDGDDDAGHQHAAPATGGKAEIPAREMAGDHRADAQRPERPDAGIALQAALFEVAFVAGGVLHTTGTRRVGHEYPPVSAHSAVMPLPRRATQARQ